MTKKEFFLSVLAGVVATILWTGLYKTGTWFYHWANTEPYPISCKAKSKDGIFMKEYSWTINIPLKRRSFTSALLINKTDYLILNNSLSSSSGEIQYLIGEDKGGNFKGAFIELDPEKLPQELNLTFLTRSSDVMEKEKCDHFQILLK
jgi:hypothetical protein